MPSQGCKRKVAGGYKLIWTELGICFFFSILFRVIGVYWLARIISFFTGLGESNKCFLVAFLGAGFSSSSSILYSGFFVESFLQTHPQDQALEGYQLAESYMLNVLCFMISYCISSWKRFDGSLWLKISKVTGWNIESPSCGVALDAI